MSWLVIALSGHFANALAFLVDKFLLTKRVPSPFVYAFFIGILGALAAVLIPFGFSVPPFVEIIRSLAAGGTFVLALVFFFASLKANEASRVVPLTGGLIPAFTLALAYVFVGERLAALGLLGFIFLVAGGVLITVEQGKQGTASQRGYAIAVLAAVVFAVSSVLMKQVYEAQEFIPGFVWSRAGGVLAALAIFLVPRHRQEILHQPKQKGGTKTALLFFSGQAVGALGFILVNYAISLAPVSLVNATQGVQYAFLLVLVVVLSRVFPRVLKEPLGRRELAQKIIAIALISLGLVFIAL